jgi:hypothetical protein
MNQAWSVLAAALVATDDSQPITPQPSNHPFRIEFKINGAKVQVPACQPGPRYTVATPATCSAKLEEPCPCNRAR